MELNHLWLIEDQGWQQNSTVRWLKEGDQNTSIFHRVASGRYRTNMITPAMIPLRDNTSVHIMQNTIIEVFKNVFMILKDLTSLTGLLVFLP